jgi:hypothetical protein
VILNLAKNPIIKIENMKNLKKLENLDLRNCMIQRVADMKELSELDSLINLNITENGTEGRELLRIFIYRFCILFWFLLTIGSLENFLSIFENLNNFRVIDYRGNKIITPNKCRMLTLKTLKHLTYLNDSPVTLIDRKKMKMFYEKGDEGVEEVMEEERKLKKQSHSNYINEIKEARRRAKESNGKKLRCLLYIRN